MSVIIAIVVIWFWWRAFEIETNDVTAMVSRLHWLWLPVILLLLAVHVTLSARRWSVIEVGLGGQRPAFRVSFGSGAIAMGLGTFLPAPLMNVACRGLANRIAGASGGRGALSGAIDQGSDFVLAGLLAIPAGFALLQGDPNIYLWAAPPTVVVGLALVFAVMRARPILQRLWPEKSSAWIPILLSRKSILHIYTISVLRIVNLTLITMAVNYASGEASPKTLAVAVPLVMVTTAISMLPGAIGVSEWSFSAILQLFGEVPEETVIFILANRLLLTVLPIILAFMTMMIVLLRYNRSERTPSEN
ncbi:flippase-like domain-containing protein [Erythrobacteraceae bacterium E2-1 Yellow Sea]|nr:flippase-like domain-containing protein [Erythrobacteraceae bacterium E2-1 Yellow Sea]